MKYHKIFKNINNHLGEFDNLGTVASYIPELSSVDPLKFGIHLTTITNKHFSFGDSDEKFSIQSISKVLSSLSNLHFGKLGGL